MMIFKRYMLRERILSNVDLHHCKWNLLIIRKNIYEDFLKDMHNLSGSMLVKVEKKPLEI